MSLTLVLSPLVRTVRMVGGIARLGYRVVGRTTAAVKPGSPPVGAAAAAGGHEPAREVAAPHELHDVAGSSAPVELLPYPQLEEPVPVVEQALAAEAARETDAALVGGLTTEPRASSRKEEHGEVPLRPAERRAIAEEADADPT